MIKQMSSNGRSMKLGRRVPTSRPKLHLKNYLRGLPSPPPSCDYSPKAASVLSDIMQNDSLGDCVIACGYHVVGVETGNANFGLPSPANIFHASPQQIIHDYSAIGGYVPGDPSTDQGCEIPVALDYWLKTGFADGTKLLGHLAVDATNKTEVMLACFLFENLVFGMALPDQWINPFPSSNGFTWDIAGASDPSNGHCVAGVGYNAAGVKIDSWGMLGTLTWTAVSSYASPSNGGELHVILTPDQLAKGMSKAPNGIAWTDLLTDFNAMGGNVPVPAPPPAPPSPPAPPAAKTLTLAQVQALLASNWPK